MGKLHNIIESSQSVLINNVKKAMVAEKINEIWSNGPNIPLDGRILIYDAFNDFTFNSKGISGAQIKVLYEVHRGNENYTPFMAVLKSNLMPVQARIKNFSQETNNRYILFGNLGESTIQKNEFFVYNKYLALNVGRYQLLAVFGVLDDDNKLRVGEVFPFMRTHNVLNNLQTVVTDIPLVVFFPGEYEASLEMGFNLRLFGKFSGPYYRAFKLEDYLIRGNINA